MLAPSGEQVEIAFGDQRAVVTEVGGGLRAYSVGARQVVDSFEADQMCPSGRGQVLIPWPNRISKGSYEFQGRKYQLPINEHVTHSAIHGLVRWLAWDVAERQEHRVVVAHDLHPQPGYPFALTLRIEYTLSDDGLRVSTSATNVGSDTVGPGLHGDGDPRSRRPATGGAGPRRGHPQPQPGRETGRAGGLAPTCAASSSPARGRRSARPWSRRRWRGPWRRRERAWRSSSPR